MIVLRTVGSSLCPNTGAVGLISVNGVPTSSGSLTAKGNLIQTEAEPGDHVAAIIHAVPLFNGISCVRLGELEVHLEECDLVSFASKLDRAEGVLNRPPLATRDWYAWNDHMPPPPDVFHVVGEVQVPNPGVDVLLVPKMPQGINPRILLLDLILVQRPGLWIQIPVWKPARYEKVKVAYTGVEIFCGSQSIAIISVDDVQ